MGALGGSTIGKSFDGQKLLFLFALVMILIGVLMLKKRHDPGTPGVQRTRAKAPRVLGYGLVTGVFSGFFGIGGGFVPGLVGSTGMPMLNAVGGSLVAVMAFGLTTAINYAASRPVDWALAFMFIGGGVLGVLLGTRVVKRLSGTTGRLTTAFSSVVFVVAAYMLVRSAGQA